MISGVRDQVLALACLRHGEAAVQGRGIDRLPPGVTREVSGDWALTRESLAAMPALSTGTLFMFLRLRQTSYVLGVGDEDAAAEKARFKESRRFSKAVEEILGGAPDIVFEHVGQATFPTSVLCVKPFGKVVICGATSGYQLDFDVRYLWMRQKEIIGSHFANAWEAHRANELIEESKIRPVLWRTMGFDGVAEAHQMLRENRHLGKIAILVGATQAGQGASARGPGAIHAEVG